MRDALNFNINLNTNFMFYSIIEAEIIDSLHYSLYYPNARKNKEAIFKKYGRTEILLEDVLGRVVKRTLKANQLLLLLLTLKKDSEELVCSKVDEHILFEDFWNTMLLFFTQHPFPLGVGLLMMIYVHQRLLRHLVHSIYFNKKNKRLIL